MNRARKFRSGIAVFAACTVLVFAVVCSKKVNPYSLASNATVTITLADSSTSGQDSLQTWIGATVTVRAQLLLVEYVDSVEISLSGCAVSDTLFSITDQDTIISAAYVFDHPCTALVRVTAFVQDGSMREDSARIIVVEKPGTNTAPRLMLHPSHTYATPSLPCSISVRVDDDQAWQTLTVWVTVDSSAPDTLSDTLLVFTPMISDTGLKKLFVFSASDNGVPPLTARDSLYVLCLADVLSPSAPVGLAVVSRADSVVVLSWDRLLTADYYKVYRTLDPSSDTWTVFTVYDTVFTDTVSGDYFYRVVAVNPSGESGFSETIIGSDTAYYSLNVRFADSAIVCLESASRCSAAVRLSKQYNQTLRAYYSVASGASAAAGADYVLADTSRTLTFQPGVETAYIILSIINDFVEEPAESLALRLDSVSAGFIGDVPRCVFAIVDDDGQSVSFAQAASTVAESQPACTVGVALNFPADSALVLYYSVVGSEMTAEAADFGALSGSLAFAAGTQTQNIVIPIVNDTIDERDETIVLDLVTSDTIPAGLHARHTVTITDNDAATVGFGAQTLSVSEDTGGVPVSLNLSTPSDTAVSVTVDTILGTAAPADFSVSPRTVVFAAGQTARVCSLTVVDDLRDENDETFKLILSGPVNVALGSADTLGVTIADNDNPPEVYFVSPTSSAGEGVGTATVDVRLMRASGLCAAVHFSIAGVTATSGSDFTYVSIFDLSFAPGDTVKTISLVVADDQEDEADETVQITLSSPTNASLGLYTTHTLTIIDNDAVPAGTWCVDASAASGGNGKSWATPLNSLMAALDSADNGDEIWVKCGTYKPSTQSATFQLKTGVSLYGGFEGGEIDKTLRNATAYPCTLSGEIGTAAKSDNVWHVINCIASVSNVTVDGFVITRGNAGLDGTTDRGGGGILEGSNLAFNGCKIVDNIALSGGGFYIGGTNIAFQLCTFERDSSNTFGGVGGCVTIVSTASDISFSRCVFSGNSAASWAGGVYINDVDMVSFDRCAFYRNRAWEAGKGAAVYATGSSLVMSITNCLFADNAADRYASGLCIGSSLRTRTIGCTFADSVGIQINYASAVYLSANDTLAYCVIKTRTPPLENYSIYAGASSGTGAFVTHCTYNGFCRGGRLGVFDSSYVDVDFVDAANPAGADGIFMTGDDGLRLNASHARTLSSCINVQDPSATFPNNSVPAVDIRGASRPQEGWFDKGAYEHLP